MRKFEIIVILLLIVIIGGGLYWLNKDNSISMEQEGKTTLSPTQIKSIEAIGQWEFLSISDEELIDTVRKRAHQRRRTGKNLLWHPQAGH